MVEDAGVEDVGVEYRLVRPVRVVRLVRLEDG